MKRKKIILNIPHLFQVGRDETKAKMKELESELARAEQTAALREEVFFFFSFFALRF